MTSLDLDAFFLFLLLIISFFILFAIETSNSFKKFEYGLFYITDVDNIWLITFSLNCVAFPFLFYFLEKTLWSYKSTIYPSCDENFNISKQIEYSHALDLLTKVFLCWWSVPLLIFMTGGDSGQMLCSRLLACTLLWAIHPTRIKQW